MEKRKWIVVVCLIVLGVPMLACGASSQSMSMSMAGMGCGMQGGTLITQRDPYTGQVTGVICARNPVYIVR